MELKSILAVIRRHFRLIAACAAISAAAALVVSLIIAPSFEATTKLVVGPALQSNVQDLNQLLSSQQVAQTYAEAVHTQRLAQQVIADLGLKTTPDELLKRIGADVSQNTPVITIRVTDGSASTAAAIANNISQQLITRSNEIQGKDADMQKAISDQIAALNTQIAGITDQIKQLNAQTVRTATQDAQLIALSQQLASAQSSLATLLAAQLGNAATGVAVLDPAVVPSEQSSPKLALNLILGLTFGVLLGLVIAFSLASLDDTFKSNEDVEQILHLPVLGSLGRLPESAQRLGIYRLVMLLYPRSGAAEAFRSMRTSVEFADIDTGVHSLLITSPAADEGKSTIAANLALAFAQAGRRTFLVDADLRKPSVHQFFDLSNTYGLTSLIRSPEVLQLEQILRTVDEPNLRILTSGPLPPNPAELLGSQRMLTIVERLKSEADLVIFDSPPVGAVTDAAVLASLVDGTILVVAAERTRRGAARQAEESLARVGGRTLGVVLNRLAGRPDGDYTAYPYEQPGAAEVAPG